MNRSVIDGLPSGDFKSISSAAEYLSRCEFVQHLEVSSTTLLLHVRGVCLPAMRKDRKYDLKLALNAKTFDIIYASCGCPAGKGPSGSCKHIGALCYSLSDFCKGTCTDRLQSWNKPRGRKVDPIPVDELSSRRSELMKRNHGSMVVYDPRPHCYRKGSPASVENLRCDLLNTGDTKPCDFLTILVSSVRKIEHDHTYALPHNDAQQSNPEVTASVTPAAEYCSLTDAEHSAKVQTVMHELCLTNKERLSVEAHTRDQYQNHEWYQARRYRITGSKCGRILIQQKRTVALLRFCLYQKPFYNAPKPIEWGRRNEPVARRAYVAYMKSHGHPRLAVHNCGFFVHHEKGWLGASPDARVSDPDSSQWNGIAEFKCPFSKADVPVETASTVILII